MPRSCPTLISGCRFGIPVSECFRHILQSCLKPSLGGELKKSICAALKSRSMTAPWLASEYI